MVYFSTYEEFENFLEELEYLKSNTILSPLSAAKVSYLRGKTRNQREVDMVEYKYRFKVWQHQFEKEWHRQQKVKDNDFFPKFALNSQEIKK